MNFGKKLAIIGLIIFGVGVPSTALSMTMFGNMQSSGLQYNVSVDDISMGPNQERNIKHTFNGHNPILVNFYSSPEGIPYHVTITNYERNYEVLNVLNSNSSEHRIEGIMRGTYDFDFINVGDQWISIDMEIVDAEYGKQNKSYEILFGLFIYVWYTVFFGGIIVGTLGAAIWKTRK